jgi:prophage maintenance system killer protein
LDKIFPKLYRQYVRERDKISCNNPCGGLGFVEADDVLRAHFLLTDYFIREGEEIALAGVRSEDLLLSALGRQCTGWGREEKWETPYEKIATLFFGLVKDHPFYDGNKRTAYLIALLHMAKFNLVPTFRQREFEEVTVKTAASELQANQNPASTTANADSDVYRLARFFKTNSRKSDKRRYEVTYRDLDSILNRFGFGLEKPNKNFVDVVRYEKKKRIIGWKRIEVVEHKKVFNVAFPGWTKRAKKDTVRAVRAATGLTADKGYDSAVFFKGHDSLPALIATYHGPLLRLKDK